MSDSRGSFWSWHDGDNCKDDDDNHDGGGDEKDEEEKGLQSRVEKKRAKTKEGENGSLLV